MFLYAISCYNPFFIGIKDKSYEIDTISVFENGMIIARESKGWFGSNNNCRGSDGLEIDCDCVKKNKVDLNCETAFIVRSKCEHETRYDLYIPNYAVKLGEPVYIKEYDTMIGEFICSTINDKIKFHRVKNCCPAIKEQNDDYNKVVETLKRAYNYKEKLEVIDGAIEKLKAIKENIATIKDNFDKADLKELFNNN